MTIVSDYVNRMVAAGIAQDEAMQIAAELFAAGAASASFRSSNAIRQERYRERKRNKSVTNRNVVTPDSDTNRFEETVTNRNKTVTTLRPLSLNSNKKIRKRESSQFAEGWKPDEKRWDAALQTFGAEGRDRELRKFSNNARAKGLKYKNWDFAWDTWVDRAIAWAPKANAFSIAKPTETNWRQILESYQRFKHWPKGHGNEPGSPSCRAPPELLREFGFLKETG